MFGIGPKSSGVPAKGETFKPAKCTQPKDSVAERCIRLMNDLKIPVNTKEFCDLVATVVRTVDLEPAEAAEIGELGRKGAQYDGELALVQAERAIENSVVNTTVNGREYSEKLVKKARSAISKSHSSVIASAWTDSSHKAVNSDMVVDGKVREAFSNLANNHLLAPTLAAEMVARVYGKKKKLMFGLWEKLFVPRGVDVETLKRYFFLPNTK